MMGYSVTTCYNGHTCENGAVRCHKCGKPVFEWRAAQPAHNVSWNIEKFRIEWETLREMNLETEELYKKVAELAVKWFGV